MMMALLSQLDLLGSSGAKERPDLDARLHQALRNSC
jgi:hypothetical protein